MRIRTTRDAAAELDAALQHFALGDQGSALGYGNSSHIQGMFIGRTDSKKVNRSVIPMNGMTEHYGLMKAALTRMPEEIAKALLAKHMHSGSVKEAAFIYSKAHHVSVSTFYNRVEAGYWYILGVYSINN